MGIGDLADDLLDGIDGARREVGSWFEPTLRLGVTGLSGAGKTVFITSLVASLLNRGRLRMLGAQAEGRIEAVHLRPQPNPEIPRFAYEAHLKALTGQTPSWPQSTRSVSQLRLSLRYRPAGMLSGVLGPSTLHLDIVDYPGEWLLDLTLLEQDYAEWAAAALEIAASPARASHAVEWTAALDSADPQAPHEEPVAQALSTAYRAYLQNCRNAGHSALAPGRFLMPGDLDGSPALTFAPLPRPARVKRGSLYAQMEERFEAYKRVVAKPFFRDHFARLDRQVVLIDALGALANGPRAVADLTATMAETLTAFRHGNNSWLDKLLGGRRIDRLLFCASKSDHLHHTQHPRLLALVDGMLAEAKRRAEWAGAETRAIAIAAIRATAEQELMRDGRTLKIVRGIREDTRREAAIFPGDLPSDPRALLATADAAAPGEAPPDWPDASFAALNFAPPAWGDAPGDGPPHIRLDSAIDFLIGDKLE
ncbi:YcjX family protein [Rhodobacteraceae bacterium NNCM2]|nr:YcjX family protein [Coraliihabitans acroporae]